MCHIEMLPANELSVAHKENLNHSVSLVSCQGNDILILPVAVRDFLSGRNFVNAVI